MSNFKVGDRVKAKHRRNSDTAEITVSVVLPEALESEVFYFWHEDWEFELLARPWELPTQAGIYVNELDAGLLGSSIRVWQLTPSGQWI